MKIKILCYLLFLVIATWLGLQLSHQPGYILISYSNINIETSLWFGMLTVIAIFIALYIILATLQGIWRTANNCGAWLGTTSEHKKLELAIAAITAATYENWSGAEKVLHKYAASHDFMAHIATCYIKSKHDLNAGIAQLEKLYLKYPLHNKFILLIKAHIYLSYNKYNDAICTIECLNVKERNTDCFNYILIKCYYNLGFYAGIHDLLPKCSKLLPATEYHEICLYYYKEQLKHETGTQVILAWKKVPKQLWQEPECLLIYIAALLQCGDKTTAQKLLLKYIPHSWHPALLREYIALTPQPTAIIQLTRWHEQHKQEPSLLLALAELHPEHKALAASFYKKALAITTDNHTLLAAIAYYLDIKETQEATKLLKILANNS
jgi:HemY protein